MDLSFTPEEQAFRAKMHDWFKTAVPADIAASIAADIDLTKEQQERWHAILNARGWLTYAWPVGWGGKDWGPIKEFIFDDERARANAPRILPFGFAMLAPVLMKFGTKAQCDHWLPRMQDGRDWWCQGYSEPGAGSDLASLKTSARRDGDTYVINGQKTWTTYAQHATMMFCLVRTTTEGKPQQGISFVLIDMKTPGVDIRPIRTLEGGHEVNEVFLTDVRVPSENLVGQENMGWTYAKFLLTHERTNIANLGTSQQKLDRLKTLAKTQMRAGRPLAEDPLFAARLARIEIDLRNAETTNLRVLATVAGGGAPGAESSMLKIIGSEIGQSLDSLTRRALGRYAQPHTPEVFEPGYNGPTVGPDGMANAASAYFNNRKISIYGGSNEIQKNIISKMILGL